ncbi:hypothetical protein [Ereboglobus luteus]|uniref:hypothetical protein n=1 Tax=Ereboglobus luteus TaxID=1796921 RepID=UPI0012601C65|nr:hypothetical protein [Ereboglobus luteus]
MHSSSCLRAPAFFQLRPQFLNLPFLFRQGIRAFALLGFNGAGQCLDQGAVFGGQLTKTIDGAPDDPAFFFPVEQHVINTLVPDPVYKFIQLGRHFGYFLSGCPAVAVSRECHGVYFR